MSHSRLTPAALHFLSVLLVLPLLGCPPSTGSSQLPSCSLDDGLAANTLSASVDGSPWEATSSGYQLVATGLLASFSVDAQNTMSIRLVDSTEFYLDEDGSVATGTGDDIQFILDQGNLPASFELGDTADEGADSTLGIEGSTMHTGSGDGGYLELVSLEGGVLRGCFEFHAGEQSGSDSVTVEGGSFALTAL